MHARQRRPYNGPMTAWTHTKLEDGTERVAGPCDLDETSSWEIQVGDGTCEVFRNGKPWRKFGDLGSAKRGVKTWTVETVRSRAHSQGALFVEALETLSGMDFTLTCERGTWELKVRGDDPWQHRAQDLEGLLRWWRGGSLPTEAALETENDSDAKAVESLPRRPRLRLRR